MMIVNYLRWYRSDILILINMCLFSCALEENIPRTSRGASLVAQTVKNPPARMGDLGSVPGLGRSPGEGMATHSCILAWRIPCTIQSMGSQRVGHD